MARGFNYAPGASAEVDEATRPELTKDRVTALGASRNALVREAIARREDCPFGLMVTLAHDHATTVRAAIAANPRTLHSVLEYLSHDRHLEVVCAVAANPAVTADILEPLATHRKAPVREAAAAALDARAAQSRTEDSQTPELRDRVFAESQDRLAALLATPPAPEPAAEADDVPAPSPLPHRLTRTAPVRGFRESVES